MLETSGLADPANILHAIERDPVLVSNVVIADVVIVVDAARGVSDLVHEPLARIQVEQADTVIVTKADLVDDDELGVVMATISSVNPGAEVRVTAFGEPHPCSPSASAAAVPLPTVTAPTAPARTRWVPVPGIVDWTVLSLWLGALVVAYPDQVLRVKGVLRTPRGPVILHAARGTIGVATVLDTAVDDADCGMLFVVRDLDPDAVHESWDAHRRALSSDP